MPVVDRWLQVFKLRSVAKDECVTLKDVSSVWVWSKRLCWTMDWLFTRRWKMLGRIRPSGVEILLQRGKRFQGLQVIGCSRVDEGIDV